MAAAGGEAWFLASPLAAQLLRPRFPDRVRELAPRLAENHRRWRILVDEVRPHAIVFSELYSLLAGARDRRAPLATLPWLAELARGRAALLWLNLMGSTRLLRGWVQAPRAGWRARAAARLWARLLERTTVLLPCPLHEPGPVEGRVGAPYRTLGLPLSLPAGERERVRVRYLGGKDGGILLFHAVPGWISRLAGRCGAPLYGYLAELLGAYAAGLGPVTLVSVNDGKLLRAPRGGGVRVVNLARLPAAEYDALLLSADLALTENASSYTLGKTLGSVPGMVLVNSRTRDQVLEGVDDPEVRRVAEAMERRHPGSIYPHTVYPLVHPDHSGGPVPRRPAGTGEGAPFFPFPADAIRVGELPSSPCVRAELYGGDATRALLHAVLRDPGCRARLRRDDEAYLRRQRRLPTGAQALEEALSGPAAGTTALA